MLKIEEHKKGDGSIFDILKFVLSIMVVCIHINRLPDWANPLLRTAVPLFFTMTSYFFFLKQAKSSRIDKQKNLLVFVKRNFFLFLFWTLALLPFWSLSIMYQWNFVGLVQFVRDVLFCDTFKGSWFIMASIQSVVLVSLLSEIVSNRWLFVFSCLSYCLCCGTSNYCDFLSNSAFFVRINNIIHHAVGEASLSFLSAMIWVTVGKTCAEQDTLISRISQFLNRRKFRTAIILSFFCLYIEYCFVFFNYGRVRSNDCYFFLVPLCVILFIRLLQCDTFSIDNHLLLRRISTVIFCVHGVIITLLSKLNTSLLLFLTLGLSCALALTLVAASNNKMLSFLKYSY